MRNIAGVGMAARYLAGEDIEAEFNLLPHGQPGQCPLQRDS